MNDKNQNKTLFSTTQIIIVSIIILILGLVGIYAFSRPATEETEQPVQTEEVEEESETSENIEETTTTTREFEYQQELDINDYISEARADRNYIFEAFEFDEELDAFVIVAAEVNVEYVANGANRGEEGYLSEWNSVLEDFEVHARELSRLATDSSIETHVMDRDKEDIHITYVGGNLAYDAVNGYADWVEVE